MFINITTFGFWGSLKLEKKPLVGAVKALLRIFGSDSSKSTIFDIHIAQAIIFDF